MIFDKLRLDCVRSIFSIIDTVFLERENHQELFEKLREFMHKLSDDNSHKTDFLADYVKLELEILKTLGYGIDLTSCAVSDATTGLAFVSPKSARALKSSPQTQHPYSQP
jgi:DNA repair protein RecO (recombination protein O)